VRELLAAAVSAIGGSQRPGQIRMAEAVAAALESGRHLCVQAGTGTGKSLAYLVPALAHGDRVVVSTATLALQSQLVDRDLPRLVEAVEPLLGGRPSYAILKGRRNYACLQRLHDGVDATEELALFDASDAGAGGRHGGPGATGPLGKEVVRLRGWAEDSTTGDRGELRPGVADRAWAQVSVSARDCIGAHRCTYGSECFAEQARERAAVADIVVTNHALLAIDALEPFPILGDHDVVVVDEAHELVDRVTGAATDELRVSSVERVVRRAQRHVKDRRLESMLAAGDRFAQVIGKAEPGRLDELPAELGATLTEVRDCAHALVTALGRPKSGEESDGFTEALRRRARIAAEDVHDVAVRLLGHADHDVAWVEHDDMAGTALKVAPLSVAGLLRDTLFTKRTVILTSATLALGGSFDIVARQVGLTHPRSAAAPGDGGDPTVSPRGARDGGDPRASRRGVRDGGIPGESPRSVRDGGSRTGSPSAAIHVIGSTPWSRSALDGAEAPASDAAERATGAERVTVAQPVTGAEPGSGVEPVTGAEPDEEAAPRWDGLDVGSPFDFRRQAILYVARRLPPPGRNGISAEAIEAITSLVRAAGGRTLGLFSSYRAAVAAAEAVRPRVPYSILLQGEETTGQLVRDFAADPRTCLFGTLSLWQGVDIPGAACQLVVIDRLPFPRPDDPIRSARQRAVDQAGGNGFMTVAAAHAALLLAQGAGRLIRSTDDRGVVAVLDSRLATARYAGFLKASLPEFWYTEDHSQVCRSLTAIDAQPT
jgi:ATP-dependent DNA helicase DinG